MLGYAIAAGLAGVVAAGYNTMAPRSQLYGRTFLGKGRSSRQLALTFDDGPNDPHTLALLEVLARHNVRATFFVLGRFVVQRPEILRELARAGHVIGNHTFNHPNLIFSTQPEVESQIRDCEKAIRDALGEKPSSLFRPPYGGRRPSVLRTVRRLGYIPVMWTASGWDWKADSAAAIEHSLTRQVAGGDIILLHDGGHRCLGTDRSRTVLAVDRLITRYRGEGYEFVTVPEMM